MPPLGPIKRKDLIYYLQRLDFQGPFSEGEVTLRIPNPHKNDIGRDFLLRILKQAGISRRDWEKL